jgi:1,4-alpha-glucan branching enzyme
VYYDYHIGVPKAGSYKEVFNSDELKFGGSGQVIDGEIFTEPKASHGFDQRVSIKIPPMATLVLKPVASKK